MLDSSAAIVLFASGHCAEIVRAWPGTVHVVPEVIAESRFLRASGTSHGNGTTAKDPIDWAPLIDSRTIAMLGRAEPEEFTALVRYAISMDDGEAAAAAAAWHRGFTLAIDDRKARDVLASEVSLRWSLDLVANWCHLTNPPAPEITQMLREIRYRGRYVPHRGHPLASWWNQYVDVEPT